MTSKERHEARYNRRKEEREKRKAACAVTFEQVFTFEHLYESYKKCCLCVNWKNSTQTYRANAMMNVYKAYEALRGGKFKSKGFVEFDIFERGKPRHIRAVHISERVVQRCLCDYALTPMLGRSFIYDNGASTRGKGASFTINRLMAHLRRHWLKYGNEGYVLTFDIHRYFDTVPHEALFAILDRGIPDERITALAKRFIDAFGGVGLGLGSQVSQICALAFLNGLDHTIKEKAGISGYGRYMDDGYLLSPDKAYLRKCKAALIRYAASLGVALNENKTQITALRRGFTFLKITFSLSRTGAVVKRPNRKNIAAMRRKLRTFKRWLDEGRASFAPEDVKTSLASWRGHMKHCRSWRSRESMNRLYEALFA